MFNFSDIWIFILALLLTLPLVTAIHQAGHVFFARIFGGKIKFAIGAGKTIIRIGPLEIKRIYFMDGWCQYSDISVNKKWAHLLIYFGGSLFNIASILIVNSLIHMGVLPVHLFFYQFVYFSIYLVFFSLFPLQYRDGHPSDGKAIYDLVKYGKREDPVD
ncbi:hypothetical protein [Pseudalkalibacillus caeni]|uniref:Peptidase M50 domain-containing protein n=1 Tax=Exobacillus caeni TaxID=2574798 RepID=A0A5R9F388_9BACL|nr:hypothetical protein [Pseudalkalibacillus caeni]TLS38152.1 hypothetical protein FCL54_06320 [Pseudalkalibacillus caeni]